MSATLKIKITVFVLAGIIVTMIIWPLEQKIMATKKIERNCLDQEETEIGYKKCVRSALYQLRRNKETR